MNLKCGIVGLPNAGKSTLFNALVSSGKAKTADYPFCTIDPNTGTAPVPDPRLSKTAELMKSKRVIPAFLEFADIAGLVKGASKGEGLGNRFLSHIRETRALLHVLRSFSLEEGGPPPSLKDDAETVNLELLLADMETAEKRLTKIEKAARIENSKSLRQETAAVQKALKHLQGETALRNVAWTETELPFIQKMNFITFKPVLYVINQKEGALPAAESSAAGGDASAGAAPPAAPAAAGSPQQSPAKQEPPLPAFLQNGAAGPLFISCALEAEIAQLNEEDKKEFLPASGLKEPALDRVIRSAYKLLDLVTFFTAGEKETRAWTLRKGLRAPEAGGLIHSDFEKGFIRADVYSCEELFRFSSEKELAARGLMRLEGKNYIVQDGDVMHFRFAV